MLIATWPSLWCRLWRSARWDTVRRARSIPDRGCQPPWKLPDRGDSRRWVLLVPSLGFMLLIERFLKAETLAKIG
jgi:hypothetical protein